MKKIVISMLLLLIIGVAFVGYKYKKQIKFLFFTKNVNTVETNVSEPVLATFSFQPEFENHLVDSFQHLTIWIFDLKHCKLNGDILNKISKDVPVLITLETWGGNQLLSKFTNPLEDVVKGKYDAVFKTICSEWIGSRKNVFLRFNPEMEVPVTRYPWQYRDWSDYIEAFRHFAGLCKIYSPQAKQVWGPAGYPGTMEYYPGGDVVDAISVTLKSDSEMLLEAYPKNYAVGYDLFRRIHRLRFADKPVMILGSPNNANDSIDQQLITHLTQLVSRERDVVYSEENYRRHELKDRNDRTEKFEIGLYDPQSQLIEDKSVTVEHLFADFGNLHDGTFQKSFNQVTERAHNVIVTFEPFRNPDGKTDLEVLQHVTEGMYYKEISQFYSIILSTRRKVYLRYAHEMEIPITRYPWQSQNPVTYIKSYRYFMNFNDLLPQNIKRVWGPAGDRGSLEWWPGNDVVDFISIAIYGLPDKNITDPEKQESFETIFNRKYWRFRFVDKPFFITEFGVKGPEEYQTKWLEAAAKVIRKNPQIKGINYFNMSDTPLAWGEIKPPDWSITKESFHRFLEVLNGE